MKLRTQKSVPENRLAIGCGVTLALLFSALASPVQAADSPRRESIAAGPAVEFSYADLADLASQAPIIVKAQVRKIAPVTGPQAAGLKDGWARLYVEAKTEAVLGGRTALGESLRYLADVKLDAKGKVPKLAKRSVILFARPVEGRPGELQLVAPDAQLLWDPLLEPRVRGVLAELYAPSAPDAVTGVREAMHVGGALMGEGESQFFLATASESPAAIAVLRSAGQEARWSVSFSELVETASPPPARDTLVWYRLACFLPKELPPSANLSVTPEDQQAAANDYRFVIEQLGPCPRLRR